MRYATCILITLLLSSCASNVFYLDVEKNKLWSNGKRINSFTIESDSLQEIYSIYWNGVYSRAPYSINLGDPDATYNIEKNRKLILNNKEFKLTPLSSYKIWRGGGDAAPHFIKVWTDSTGRIVSKKDNAE
jgi:hypothetical protein